MTADPDRKLFERKATFISGFISGLGPLIMKVVQGIFKRPGLKKQCPASGQFLYL